MYIRAPSQDKVKSVAELKGFKKTGILRPQQSQTVSFTIGLADICAFNSFLSLWVAEKGNYAIKIGASSVDVRLEADFNKVERSELAL